MATGLMTLAYMAELGVVFNLAYAELSKGRYIANARASISELRTHISPEGVIQIPGVDVVQVMSFWTRVNDMLNEDKDKRVACWKIPVEAKWFRWGTDRCFRFSANYLFNLFDSEYDRRLSQFSIVAASAILICCTLVDNSSSQVAMAGASYVKALSSTFAYIGAITASDLFEWFFVLLLIAMIGPLALVLMGRRLAKVAKLTTDQLKQEFNQSIVTKMTTKLAVP